MKTEDVLILVLVLVLVLFIGGGIYVLTVDDFGQDFCERQGHNGVDASLATRDGGLIICYDNAYNNRGERSVDYVGYRFFVTNSEKWRKN